MGNLNKICLVLFGLLEISSMVASQGLHSDCGNKRGIASLTFDDGPHPQNTARVMDVLKANNLKATFFLQGLGSWESSITRYNATIQRMLQEGHQIGSHTWSHTDLKELNETGIREELQRMADHIYTLTGKNMSVMRPPFGSYDERVLRIAQQEFNYDVIIWNVDTEDWLYQDDVEESMKAWINAMNDQGSNSSYIGLHHDPMSGHTNLTESVIALLKSNNISMTTVADCIDRPMYN